MRSGNPALSNDVFVNTGPRLGADSSMTVDGAVNRSGILFAILMFTASYTWYYPSMGLGMVGMIGGFICAIAIIFKKEWSPYLAPAYAGLEGLFLGGMSSVLEAQYPGIAIQAVGLTFAVFGSLLAAYKSGMIKVTDNFRLGVVAATGGLALFYLAGMILSLFGVHSVANLHSISNASPLSLGISGVAIVIASFNLVLDFDFIENGERAGAPKYMEWYAAFGLMVTLVWLYIELLRLLAKLNQRD